MGFKYRVILLSNGTYKKTIYGCQNKDNIFKKYEKYLEKNKEVKFPKRFINTKKIKPVKFELCVIKPSEEDDKFRTLRDSIGRVFIEPKLGDWTIIESKPYEIEENFYIWGHEPNINRPNIDTVYKKIIFHAYTKKLTKQVICVNNKLIIHNEEQFDMVICKCSEDAKRLHDTLKKILRKQKIKSVLFMGVATHATITRMYGIIMKNTGWSRLKTRRTTTRP